jgi:hypothetical protein
VRQLQFPEQSGGKGRRVTLIDEANRALGGGDKPLGKLPSFTRLGTVSTVAVQWEPHDPTGDLVFSSEFLKMLRFDRWWFAFEGL